MANWCTWGREPEAVPEPWPPTLLTVNLWYCSSGHIRCHPILESAELHAGIACSCLRSSVEAAAAHSEAAEEQLKQHQQLASAMVGQVGGTAKLWKATDVRRLMAVARRHSMAKEQHSSGFCRQLCWAESSNKG